MSRFSPFFVVALACFVGLGTATAQTAEEVDRVLAFDLSNVPAPEELLAAISDRDAYQTPVGQYHALDAVHSALTSLMMSFPLGGADTPQKQAEIDAFVARLLVPRSAYYKKMQELVETIEDDREWQIPKHRLRLPILREFLPEWVELNPDLVANSEAHAANESAVEAQGERLGVVPLAVSLLVLLAGLVIVLRRTWRRVSDPHFDFQLAPRTATVVREKRWSVTETSGSISGGGTVSPGVQRAVTGSINSKTTNYQEITLKFDDGKEQLLEYTDFEIPCMEGNTLSLVYVNRPGMGANQGAIYNHNRDELHVFEKNIRAAIRPPNSGMPWLSWWLWFALLGAGLAWFAGSTLDEGIDVIIGSIVLVGTVPIFPVAFIVGAMSRGVTRSRTPRVVAAIRNLMGELNQKTAVV